MKFNERVLPEIEITEAEMDKLAERALILLSFKETHTQNMRFLINLLGAQTLEEKKRVLEEVFRLIRQGIVFIPKGLPQILERISYLNASDIKELNKLDLCLLCPYEKLIEEIQKEIAKL